MWGQRGRGDLSSLQDFGFRQLKCSGTTSTHTEKLGNRAGSGENMRHLVLEEQGFR
jgi:hypothetical protein